MSIAAPPTRPAAAPLPPASSGRGRLLIRGVVLLLVLMLLSGVGVFIYRVHSTTLVDGGEGYAGNTPQIDLPYGGGQRYVVDDSVGSLHPIMFSVRNPGPSTVTLQGVDDFLPAIVAGFTVSRLPRNGGFDNPGAPRIPLHGVKLQPGQMVGLWMSMKGQGCASSTGGDSETIDSVPVTVSILGVSRVEWVSLPLLVTVVNPATGGTPSDPRSCLRSDAAPASS